MKPATQRKLDPETVCTRVVARLIEELGCVDIAPDSPVWQDLMRQGARVGELRVYRGRGRVQKVVCSSFALSAPAIDSHSVVVFTHPASPVPHFVLDSVHAGPRVSLHLDLLPKRDLAVSIEYLDHCYAPLSEARAELEADPRFSRGNASLRLRALLSPWNALYTLDPMDLEAAADYIDRYLTHWSRLLRSDSPELQPCADVAARDGVHRRLVYSRENDPIWTMLDRTLGRETVDQLLQALAE